MLWKADLSWLSLLLHDDRADLADNYLTIHSISNLDPVYVGFPRDVVQSDGFFEARPNNVIGTWSKQNATPPLEITGPDSLPDGNIQTPYPSQQFTATGGVPEYVWSLGDLPPGLRGTSDGQVVGNQCA